MHNHGMERVNSKRSGAGEHLTTETPQGLKGVSLNKYWKRFTECS